MVEFSPATRETGVRFPVAEAVSFICQALLHVSAFLTYDTPATPGAHTWSMCNARYSPATNEGDLLSLVVHRTIRNSSKFMAAKGSTDGIIASASTRKTCHQSQRRGCSEEVLDLAEHQHLADER